MGVVACIDDMETNLRLAATPKALALLAELKQKHGPLMLYQAGGCCEGTQPQCFEEGGFYLRYGDVLLGKLEDVAFWVDKDLFEYWKHAHFTLDVTDGIGAGGFSLETPLGKTFVVHYRLFTPEELTALPEVQRNE